MSGLSRRDLLRASAGAAAVAVPMSVLSNQGAASAAPTPAGAAAGTASTAAAAEVAELERLVGPVMFSIRDAAAGEVSILHGSSEVIVHDRQLVDRILRATRRTL